MNPKHFEINRLEVVKGLFIPKKYFLINMSSERQPTSGQTSATGSSGGEEIEEDIGRRRDSEIFVDNLKPHIISQLFGCSWEGVARVCSRIVNWKSVNGIRKPNLKIRISYIHI